MNRLVLSAAIKRRIEEEGVAAFPNECCGILIGRDAGEKRVVEQIVPMKNAFDSVEQYHRFSIDPKAMIEAEEQAAKAGQAVLGFYHSHPDHPARPSEYDRTHVPPWSYYSHVIVSIMKKVPADMTCWVLNEETEQFDSQVIEIQ